jgi:hypothetical protein
MFERQPNPDFTVPDYSSGIVTRLSPWSIGETVA